MLEISAHLSELAQALAYHDMLTDDIPCAQNEEDRQQQAGIVFLMTEKEPAKQEKRDEKACFQQLDHLCTNAQYTSCLIDAPCSEYKKLHQCNKHAEPQIACKRYCLCAVQHAKPQPVGYRDHQVDQGSVRKDIETI